ncbi:hypothetical protein [Endothiovibrio diazotrophicus]
MLSAPAGDGPLRIGARDWRHPAWRGTFYPDDLPEEWRLAYYANEFATLLVPAQGWIDTTQENLAGWAEEVHGDFRFVLEVDGAPAAQRRAAAAALGGRFGGFVATAALWRPGRHPAPLRAGLLPAGPHGPRALRGMVEPFIAQAPEGERFLFLEGTPPDHETLRTLVTLRDLLGM